MPASSPNPDQRRFPLSSLRVALPWLAGCGAFALSAGVARAQQPIGTIASNDALVSGSLAVQNDRTTLLSNASITASDHAAAISLARGGETLVCATSRFHILHSGPAEGLLFGLDRGAIQIASPSDPQDIILTPDIRFSVEAAGEFDLRLRVTRDGDTCVENRGARAPVLLLSSSFGDSTYRVLPNQHVLFEHGNLREVVDNERSPCGCPAPPPAPAQLPTNATEAQRAAAAHPFPEAASQGLSNEPEKPPTMPTEGGVRSSTEFHISAGDNAPVALTTTAPPPNPVPNPTPPPGNVRTEPPPAPPGTKDLAHMIGGFFRRIFRGKSK